MIKKSVMRRLISLSIVVGMFLALTAFSLARAGSAGTTKSVVVKPGDTLWQIASEYGSASKDIRETVYVIRNLNGLHSSELAPGQVLRIPAK